MTIDRISTYRAFERATGDFSSVSLRLSNLQQQISSGVKANDFKGLDGYVEQFTGLESTQKKQQRYIENNTESVSRLSTQNQAVTSIVEISNQMQSLIVARRSANGIKMDFGQQMTALRDSLTKQLNTTFGSRFLFGGTKTDTQPVKTPVPETLFDGTPDAGYYQGSQNNSQLRADDNFDMEISVRADDPAFQKLYAALSLAIKGDAANSDDVLAQAQTLAHDGVESVISVQATLNNDITTLNGVNDQLESSNLYLKGLTDDIAKTDLVKASSQVAVDQTILQASFQAFSTINNLQLVNFLK